MVAVGKTMLISIDVLHPMAHRILCWNRSEMTDPPEGVNARVLTFDFRGANAPSFDRSSTGRAEGMMVRRCKPRGSSRELVLYGFVYLPDAGFEFNSVMPSEFMNPTDIQ